MFEKKNKKNEQIDLYSFDIFDTLITRKVATPTGIFVLMQYILQKETKYKDFPPDLKTNFFLYRTNAEYYLRRINKLWHNNLDITFDDIYDYLKNLHYLDGNQISKLKELEIKLETESIIPITKNIEKIKSLLNEGKRVILISDMYLPENIIKQMLYKADPILADLKLYLSCVSGYMKTTGELYKYVKEKENTEYSNWKHYGDNKNADFQKAKELGINAELYPYIGFKQYENSVLITDYNNPFIQLTLGCAKNTRLNMPANSLTSELGASLTAPILYPYIDWLLKQAQIRKIKRLYFIARDGYILKLISDKLIKEKKLEIKTEYVYGSRKAWRLSSLSTNNEKLYKMFVESSIFEINELHNIFGLSKKEFIDLLPKKIRNLNKKKEEIKEFLLNDKSILKKALENNAEQKNNCINYLKKTVDYSDDNFAFVDFDGSGLTQNCLGEIFKNFYNKKIKTFYFALTPLSFEQLNIEKFYFSAFKTPLMGHVTELLTKAPHGQTIGYKEKDNNYSPILEDINIQKLKNWGVDNYIEGILKFIEEYNKYQEQYDFICFQDQSLIEKYTKFIFFNIDKESAEILGKLPHKSYGNEDREFAPKLGYKKAIKYIITNKFETESLLYSKMRSVKLCRKIIDYKKIHPNFRKQLLNLRLHKGKHEAYLNILGIKISFASLLGWKNI